MHSNLLKYIRFVKKKHIRGTYYNFWVSTLRIAFLNIKIGAYLPWSWLPIGSADIEIETHTRLIPTTEVNQYA